MSMVVVVVEAEEAEVCGFCFSRMPATRRAGSGRGVGRQRRRRVAGERPMRQAESCLFSGGAVYGHVLSLLDLYLLTGRSLTGSFGGGGGRISLVSARRGFAPPPPPRLLSFLHASVSVAMWAEEGGSATTTNKPTPAAAAIRRPGGRTKRCLGGAGGPPTMTQSCRASRLLTMMEEGK
jgi:hypothetical protein